MAQFVELDDGSSINLDHVVRLHSQTRSNRVDLITGSHLQLSEADGEKLRKAMKSSTQIYVPLDSHIDMPHIVNSNTAPKPAKRRGRPPKAK